MPDQLYPEAELERAISNTKNADDSTAFGEKSPGVRRIELIAASFTTWHRWVLFISVFLMACKLNICSPLRLSNWSAVVDSYGLDGSVRYTYQAEALSVLGTSAQVSTVTVVRSIVAAAAQPGFAKISDYFGRISILVISVILYAVGM